MRRLHAAVLAGSLLACSADTVNPGALVLGIHTNDLVITDDINLVGLYIAHQDATGKVVERLAYEVTPLIDGGEPKVSFPSTFVLQSNGLTGDRVHVKLVAYKKATRDVLTMREARAAVPTGSNQLVQLNLFFTNQNNVVDASAGTAVLDANVTLQNQTGPISQDAFDRFHSVCDGAPAPDGMTAGERGECTKLDVDAAEYDFGAGLPGSHDTDPCYDVTGTFALRADAAVRTTGKPEAGTGACTLQLPGAYDPALLNVSLLTTDTAFPIAANDAEKLGAVSLRPLAAGQAFVQNGNTVELPAHVCDLARRPEVVGVAFSQRAKRWTGGEPVCAAWSGGKAKGSTDNPAPGPAPDGGLDDGGGDTLVSELELGSLEVTEPDALLLATNTSMGMVGYKLPNFGVAVAAFHYRQPEPRDFTVQDIVSDGTRLESVQFSLPDNEEHFYLYNASASSLLHLVTDDNGDPRSAEPVGLRGADGGVTGATGGILELGDVNYLNSGTGLYAMSSPTTAVDTPAITLTGLLSFPLWPGRAIDAVGNQVGLITGIGSGSAVGYFVRPGNTASDPRTYTDYPYGSLVGVGTRFLGIGTDQSGARYLQRYVTDGSGTDPHLAIVDVVGVASDGSNRVCFVQQQGDFRVVHCGTADDPAGGATPFTGNMAQVAIDGDDQFLHVAYVCADTTGAAVGGYRLLRLPWALVGSNLAETQRCATP